MIDDIETSTDAERDAFEDALRLTCSGDIATCPNESGECSICAVRDCPKDDPFHYYHDGCPSCDGDYE